jgi:hypothetical protein
LASAIRDGYRPAIGCVLSAGRSFAELAPIMRVGSVSGWTEGRFYRCLIGFAVFVVAAVVASATSGLVHVVASIAVIAGWVLAVCGLAPAIYSRVRARRRV